MRKFAKKIKKGLEDILAYKKGKLDLRTTIIELSISSSSYKSKEIKENANNNWKIN